ncbi:PucR family transcriptional regulator [Anaerovorax sp. IOR16]|uniref:PucR family transcriptional regulator n=1 Tax=Anaerovorax sp. IOR16 TaxID=2773458 RepID=UPI0019CF9A91|nr:PucR family transcriptional regulator [Anaerovorax sp. IOR16]
MVLLRDILAIPEFSNFRVVSGFNGINEPVTSTGFFEWESGSDITKNFAKGEFVVTTLAVVKDKPESAKSCIKTLIRNKVTAIVIKDIYFSDVSDDIKECSNEHNVPIIFFSDLFVDDVLFVIKTEIRRASAEHSQYIFSSLLYDNTIGDRKLREMISQLDSFLQDNIVFCAYISLAGYDTEIPDTLKLKYNSFGNNNMKIYTEELAIQKRMHENVKYTFLPYKRGIFHIFTAKDTDSIDKSFSKKFLEKFFDINDDFRIGISSTQGNYLVIQDALREAMYSNITCILNNKTMLSFDDTGLDRMLCPSARTKETRAFLASLDLLIENTGASNSCDSLKETLVEYIACNGDVNAVAAKKHQHANTIRYRISKVKYAWNCKDELAFQTQIMIYVRTRQIIELLV